MSRWATWILAVVALVLLGAIFLGPEEWRMPRLGAEDYVLRFNSQEVRAVEVVRDGVTLRFERYPEGWMMGPQPRDRVQTGIIERVLDAAQLLRIVNQIEPRELPPEEEQTYGFAAPRYELRLETPRGVETLVFGREGIAEGQIFVRRGQNRRTYLVGDELLRLMLQPVENFRDPRLVALPVDRIERVRLNRPEGTVELQRMGERWQLTRPLQARADSAAFEDGLEKMLGARIFAFLSQEPPTNTGELIGVVELWPEGEERPQRLHVYRQLKGGEVPEGEAATELRWIVWQENRQATVEVAAENFALLQQTPDGLRSRKLAEIDPDLVDRITVQQNGLEVELRRDGEEGWIKQGPAMQPSQPVSKAWVEELFTLLQETSVLEFLLAGSPVLVQNTQSPAAVTIALDSWLSENTPETLAGRYPLQQFQFWPFLSPETDSPLPPGVLVRVDEEAGGRLLPPSFWDQWQQWWSAGGH